MLKPHGIRGEVVVSVLTDNPRRFDPGSELEVGETPEETIPIEVENSRPHGEHLLVKFSTIDDRAEIEKLRGKLLFVAEAGVAEPEGGGYWEHELVGLEVRDVSGRMLGKISEVVVREAQDSWAVSDGNTTTMVPAVPAFIKEVDLERRVVVIDPPRNLFPGDES